MVASLELDLFFLNFDIELETLMKLRMIELDIFEKLFLPPKLGGNGPKIGSFFNTFHRICSIMNFNIIFCVPEQIPYLGNLFFGG